MNDQPSAVERFFLCIAAILGALTVALWLTGCGRNERAQAGADIKAGIEALNAALAAGYATQEVVNILRGVEKYVPAATGVNPSEWPAPRMTAQQILASPAAYDSAAPPVPPSILSTIGKYSDLILSAGVALLLGGGTGAVFVSRAKAALRIACELADNNEKAETDADIQANKIDAITKQAEAGVLHLTRKARGKPKRSV